MEEILLEDEVECKYTGIKGIVTSKTEFVNGCIQFGITQRLKKGALAQNMGELLEVCIDSQSLKLIKKGPRHKKEIKEKSSGGPIRLVPKMRGF